MKFSLKQMQIFQLVAEHRSVSVAAKDLHMSQSAASMSLSQLESVLGHPLFIRQGRRMELTSWGQWLRPRVHELLANCHAIDMGMSTMDVISGRLSIGASQTPAEHLVPALLSEMGNSFPRLNLGLQVENTEHVISGLLDYQYDLGIIEGHCDDERVERSVWCEDELVIFASVNHPYCQQQETRIAQLKMAQWVLREQGAGTREIFDSFIHEYIDQLKVHREYEYVNVILAMVEDSNYLSSLSYRSVQPLVQAGRLKILNVPELSIKRDFSFIWRKDEDENLNRSAVIECALKLID